MGFPAKPDFEAHLQYFQPYQIVCLQHKTSCLYAEVVQTVEQRQICWVRPLVLAIESTDVSNITISAQATQLPEGYYCYDLRQGSDLLWPLTLFRVALDTEVIPLLAHLHRLAEDDTDSGIDQIGAQQFKQFVQSVWQAHPDIFLI